MAHIITGLSSGGAERALFNLLHGGLSEFFNNHVVSLIDEGTMGPQIRCLDIPVTTLNLGGGNVSISNIAKLRRMVKEFRPDVIQGWMYHGNVAATLARSFSIGRPILAWNVRQSLYSLDNEKPMTKHVIRVNRYLSYATDIVLYNSRLSRDQHESFGFSSRKGQVIPNGIDVEKFSRSSTSYHKIRSELGIPTQALVVGHVARLHPMKDHSLCLKVAADLALRYSDVHFIFTGRGISIENSALGQLVPPQARDRFHLLGERADISELMNAMDIFCQSSWSEAFPNVLGEAMATEIPCVATDVGDSAVIIGDSGMVVPPRDEDALAAGIEQFLMMPSETRRLLGQKARARIEENFMLESIVRQYSSLYKRLVLEKKES